MVMLLTCIDCIPPEIGPFIEQTDGEQSNSKAEAIAPTSLATPSIATPDAITQAEFTNRSPQASASVPTTEANPAWVKASTMPQPILRLGNRGEAVQDLQTQLQRQGYYTDAIDGIFGRRTQAAIREWQRSHNLTDDGVVGSDTWATLSSSPEQPPEPFTTQPPEAATRSSDIPTTSPEVNPAPQKPEPSPITFDFESDSASYFWVLGWAVIYGAGWVVIIRDGIHQHQGRTKKTPPLDHSSYNYPEPLSAEPVATTPTPHPPATPPTATSTPPTAGSTPTTFPTPLQSTAIAPPPPPEMPQVEAIGEEIPITLANAGRLTPEDYLFPYLEDHDSNIIDLSDEQIVARLPATATDLEEEVFHYSLLDRAEDLFVLRGNELRVLKSRLERYSNHPIRKTITIRRTSNRGEFMDKSFNLTIGKTA